MKFLVQNGKNQVREGFADVAVSNARVIVGRIYSSGKWERTLRGAYQSERRRRLSRVYVHGYLVKRHKLTTCSRLK